MNLLDILLIGGVGLAALYFLNVGFEGHGDPVCMFRDECLPGGAARGTPACYPCGYPA